MGLEADLFRQFAISLGNGLIFGFVKVKQVEFVDGDDDVGAAQEFQNRAAASRRSLGRVSVPMWPVILSDRLLIVALVGFYPANWLIRRGSILWR